jgi:hypothetical protein
MKRARRPLARAAEGPGGERALGARPETAGAGRHGNNGP